MRLDPAFLDNLRARVTLSGVIGRTTRLTKAGREFKACCPFHNEKTPSFTVNDEKGFYHCFGCGAHGDVIRWMTDQRGLAFMDAVKELAAEAGMEVPAPDPRAAQAAEKRDTLHDVMQAAQDWFVANLHESTGKTARDYLQKRGISPLTAEQFGFGYAPEDRQAMKAALSRFPEAMLIEAGLRIAVEDREPYDRFRARLMLPIRDARGRVIAFGGRILDAGKTDAPKYLNSPDTPLFDKGRTLYNLDRAAPAARKTGRLIVVEGYMDVVALAAAGIEEAVAPMGTALTEQQIELLWRQVESPVLCFDGDAAGQRAAMRAIGRALPMLKPAHSLRIVSLPQGLDPDDLVKRDGPKAMEDLLANSRSLVDALWAAERDAAPLSTPEDKAGLKARLLAHIDTIADQDIRSLYRRELLQSFSAFAFPKRDWSKPDNVYNITDSKRWGRSQRGQRTSSSILDFHQRPHPSWVAKHSDPKKRAEHLRRRLGAAICAGLIRFPEYALIYAETLLSIPDVDHRLGVIVDATFEYDVLERVQIEAILRENGHKLPTPDEWDNLHFPFAWPPSNEDRAIEGLEKAIKLYAGRPQIQEALDRASKVAQDELSNENWNEQRDLVLRKQEFDLEWVQMTKVA